MSKKESSIEIIDDEISSLKRAIAIDMKYECFSMAAWRENEVRVLEKVKRKIQHNERTSKMGKDLFILFVVVFVSVIFGIAIILFY